jgi:S1-C subfamily serine protease
VTRAGRGGAATLGLSAFVSTATCTTRSSTTCEVAVRWKLVDRATGGSRYTVLTRGVGRDLEAAVRDAAVRVLGREAFAAVADASAPPPPAPTTVRRCAAAPEPLPAGMKAALAATLFVEHGGGTGSGIVISPDGFVLTAAHVVAGPGDVKVRTRKGTAVVARVLAVDPRQDVALLRAPGADWACLPIAAEPAEVGTELYAVGSPLGEALEFSVSKGIVSGARRVGDVRFLQTDASLNPGNSGGPLIAIDGALLAVVSWKVAAEGLEGLGFGVPVDAARVTLAIELGETSVEPAAPTAILATASLAELRDVDDPPREGTDAAAPPGNRAALTLGGLLLAGAGTAAVVGTALAYESTPEMTATDWTLLQVANTAG